MCDLSDATGNGHTTLSGNLKLETDDGESMMNFALGRPGRYSGI